MTEQQIDLDELAKKTMRERHLFIDFPPPVLEEIQTIKGPAKPASEQVRDLRHLLWFSIDNEESKDLDQLTYAERLTDSNFRIYIAIADVDALVNKGSSIDAYAKHNTTSVYTPTIIFPMLPERLSTDWTSLNPYTDRLSIIIEIELKADGSLVRSNLYPAYVHNKAKLAYPRVAAWLDHKEPIPEKWQAIPGLVEQLQLQDFIAHRLRRIRHQQGALTLYTTETQAIVKADQVVEIKEMARNRAKDLIEDFMIAANTAVAHFLTDHHIPSLRRIVRTPKKWDRIVKIARSYGEMLPLQPDPNALDLFLIKRRLIDPEHFPDLSLTIIKLLGKGEYVVEIPGRKSVGHFSLALKDYTHSTAPNRRYPDLITQRLLKSVLYPDYPRLYTDHELDVLARQCTQKEDDAEKVERKMRKSAAVFTLLPHLNENYEGLITGASKKGTWVRIKKPPIEGKVVRGYENLDVGDKVIVKLVHLDVEKGFIDFIREIP